MALGVLQKPIRAVRLSTFNSSLLAQRRRRCTSENGDERRASFHIIIIFFKRAVSHTHIVLVFLVCASVSLWGHVAKTLSGECRKSRQPFFFLLSSLSCRYCNTLQTTANVPNICITLCKLFFWCHFLRTGFDVTIFWRWKKSLTQMCKRFTTNCAKHRRTSGCLECQLTTQKKTRFDFCC